MQLYLYFLNSLSSFLLCCPHSLWRSFFFSFYFFFLSFYSLFFFSLSFLVSLPFFSLFFHSMLYDFSLSFVTLSSFFLLNVSFYVSHSLSLSLVQFLLYLKKNYFSFSFVFLFTLCYISFLFCYSLYSSFFFFLCLWFSVSFYLFYLFLLPPRTPSISLLINALGYSVSTSSLVFLPPFSPVYRVYRTTVNRLSDQSMITIPQSMKILIEIFSKI